MRISFPIVATLGVCGALMGSTASAQAPEEACAKTRAEVQAECTQFMKTHVWNDGASNWVLKSGVKPPEGVKTREQVIAERDAFLAKNRWNDAKSMWVPIPGTGRTVSTEAGCTRKEIADDCAAFMKTHRWNEGLSKYVEVKK